MYTTQAIALTSINPEQPLFDANLSCTINASDSRKAILLEGGADCNGTYQVWGFSTLANEWYLLHDTGVLAVPYARYSIVNADYINAFTKVYVCSVGLATPTHWRLQMGSNSGGF